MGFWNDGIRSSSPTRRRSRSRSSSRSHSRSHSHSHSKGPYERPEYSRSASSFLSNITGYDKSSARHTSRSVNRGWFSAGSGYGSSRARPRNGFIARIRKFLRDLYYYMRRHPVKVFVLVIMPLITGGALTKILSQFGVRLPRGLESMMGSSMNRGVGGGDRFYARGGARDFGAGSNLPGMSSGGGFGDSIGGMMKMAKLFV